MKNIYIILLSLFTIFILIKTRSNNKTLKKDRYYIQTYQKILKKEDGAKEALDTFIEEEKDDSVKNKALIVKAYQIAEDKGDIKEALEAIDFDKVFLDKEKFSKQKITNNSDMFVWLILLVSALKDDKSLLDELYNKVTKYDEYLNKFVEYILFKSTYMSVTNQKEYNIEFIHEFLSGNYKDYLYDKQIVGLYKKIAACLLAYNGNMLKEDDKTMISEFIKTYVGKRFRKNLGLSKDFLDKAETN